MQGKSDLRYCFTVVWYDTAASLQRKYQLIYYTADGTVEMVRRHDPPRSARLRRAGHGVFFFCAHTRSSSRAAAAEQQQQSSSSLSPEPAPHTLPHTRLPV